MLECAVFANDCTVFARDCAVLARAEFPLRRFCGIAPCFLHCAILVDLRLIFFVGWECARNFGYMSLQVWQALALSGSGH